jgi:hypothetical protein
MNYIPKFLNHFNYRIDRKDWDVALLSHPHFPDITAFSETFETYGIEAIVADVPKDLFDNLPDVFLSIIIIDSQTQIVYTDHSAENKVAVIFENGKKKTYPKLEFLEIWSGILLSIEPSATETSPVIPADYSPYLKYASILAVVLCLGYLITNHMQLNWHGVGYLAVSGLGLLLSALALGESLGFLSPKVNRLCSSIEKGDCGKVIFSKSAEIIKGISLSELSFVYFASCLILGLCARIFALQGLLLVSALLSLFMVAYSIFQQIRLKTWCALCLGIALACLLQFSFAVSDDWHFVWTPTSASVFIFVTALVTAMWLLLKPVFEKLSDLNFVEIEYNSVIRQSQTLSANLESAKKMDADEMAALDLISLDNNPDALHITAVLSPMCGGCNIVYQDIRKLQSYYPGRIHFSIMLNFNKKDITEPMKQIFHKIIDMHRENAVGLTAALDDWFIHKLSEKKWLRKWGFATADHTEIIAGYNRFLNSNQLYNTPTIITNATVLPPPLKLTDLKYFINELSAT